MRKQLLAATALVAIAGAASAAGTGNTQTQAQSGQEMTPGQDLALIDSPSMNSHLASQLIGETVYTSEAVDAEAVGDITDLVIAETGEIEGVVIGVGGFLGVGEKSVAVDFDQLDWAAIQDGDQTDARLILATTAEQLEAAPAFDVSVLQTEPEDRLFGADTDDTAAMAPDAQTGQPADEAVDQPDQQAATTTPDDQSGQAIDPTDTQTADIADDPADMTADQQAAQVPADDQPSADQEQQTATITPEDQADQPAQSGEPMDQAAVAPDAETGAHSPADATADQQTATLPQDLTDVDIATISAEQLINTVVYSGEDENVGAVGDVLLSDDGMIDAVVLDIGGFLGIGTKPVAIAFDDLIVRTDADGNLYVYTPFTREQLEAATAYDAELYDDQRDSMRLTSST